MLLYITYNTESEPGGFCPPKIYVIIDTDNRREVIA